MLAAWVWLRQEGLPRDRGVLGSLVLLGVANVFGAFVFLTWGQQYVESSYAAILVASGPIFSALGATYLLADERLDGRRSLGVALGFLGVVSLFSGDLGGHRPEQAAERELAGAAAIVVAAMIVAAVGVVVRLRFPNLSAAQIALPQLLGGTATVAVLMLVAGAGGLTSFQLDLLAPWVLVSVLALGLLNAGFGNIVYYRLILQWGVTRTALVGYVAPFIGAAIGVSLLDERLGPNAVIGLALLTVGLVFVNRDLDLESPARGA